MAERIERQDDSLIVYDDSLIDHIDAKCFDFEHWRDARSAPGYSGGRGKTLFIDLGTQPCVLRHYYRGGFVGRFLDDQFLFLGSASSRPFLEFRLLMRLSERALPAPRPLAARCVRHGLIYSADLITLQLPDVEPFSSRLARGPVEEQVWRRVGETVGRFHRACIFHADLTAHNLQIDTRDQIFLLDFDRGQLMQRGGRWASRNLDRLHRSLDKISADDAIEFSAREWGWLLSGYEAG